MGFKALFIKTEDEPQNVGNTKQNVSNGRKSYTPTSVNNETVTVSSSQNQPIQSGASVGHAITADEDIINKIWDKIIAANRPGPDYLELKNNVEALEDLPISNDQKLMSAFKVLKKGYPNFQKDDIIKAIDFYVKVVNDEKEEGLKQLNSLIAVNITGVENEIQSMQSKAEELKRQYDELQSRIGEKTIELTKAKGDIDMKHNAFIGSVDAVMNVLTSDRENILNINF